MSKPSGGGPSEVKCLEDANTGVVGVIHATRGKHTVFFSLEYRHYWLHRDTEAPRYNNMIDQGLEADGIARLQTKAQRWIKEYLEDVIEGRISPARIAYR